jgi:hypothetical protein
MLSVVAMGGVIGKAAEGTGDGVTDGRGASPLLSFSCLTFSSFTFFGSGAHVVPGRPASKEITLISWCC